MKTCPICKKCFDDAETTCFDAAHGELTDARHSMDVVPGYRIERIAAESPVVSVYRALNLAYGLECFLTIAEADPQQFLADAGIASKLFHSGIAGVVESGDLADGSAFAVCEGYDGTSLRELIDDGPISLLDAIVITRQAAEAVHELHAAGLTHGAIAPENISVRYSAESPSVKLHNIDFGSAFASSTLSNRFTMQSALGAMKYFAPEQFGGSPAAPASDVYALGIVLYELLSGHPPFDADSASAVVDMQLHQKPPDIAIENFDLRMLLTHTIFESLQKQPSFRQSTADLFARQMRHIEQLATHVPTPPAAVQVKPPQPVTPSPAARSVSAQAAALALAQAPERITPPPAAIDSPIRVAQPESPVEVPVLFDEVTFIPLGTNRRSRLKGMKKRLHKQLSRTAPVKPPALIEWQQHEDDIPSLDAVREELEKLEEPLPTIRDEETTAVRPPVNRIEVELAKPSVDTSAPGFLPTLLTTGRIKPIEASGSTMFAAFQTVSRFRKLPVYSAIVAITALAGVSVMRIADREAAADSGYLGGNDPVAVQTAPIGIDSRMTETKPEPIQPVITDIGPTMISRTPVKTDRIEPTPARQAKPKDKESQPQPAAAVKIAVRKSGPIVPSTIVISTQGGRPTRTILPDNGPETRSQTAGSGNGATRPRIVSSPD